MFSLTYLPLMLKEDKEYREGKEGFGFIDKINDYPLDRKKPLLAAVILVAAVGIGAYLIGGTRFDADMHNLGYLDDMTEYSEQLLRDKTYTGDKTKYFASEGNTMEEAIENFAILDHKLDSLQQLGLVKSYTHTNQIFVPMRIQQERIDAWKAFWTP